MTSASSFPPLNLIREQTLKADTKTTPPCPPPAGHLQQGRICQRNFKKQPYCFVHLTEREGIKKKII